MKEKKTERFGFSITKTLNEKLDRISSEKGLTKGAMICLLIAEYQEADKFEKRKDNGYPI